MADDPFPYPNEIYPENWFDRLNPAEIFAHPERPLEVDLGCGDGTFLVQMAMAFPERNFIGVERLLGRCRKVWRKAERHGVMANLKILRVDSNYGVKWMLPQKAVSRLHFLCPDPWPKQKHAQRRQMCRLDFLQSIHHLLIDGGELLFKTDSQEYYEEAIKVQENCEWFKIIAWEENEFFYPITDFEQQWLDEGRMMHRLRLAAG
jgi:tRNA (guanine-N7-)-methyltransferase